MTAFVVYLVSGLVSIFLQSSVFPLFLPPDLRPNPLLILVVFAGLSGSTARAVTVGVLLGAIQDSFSGHSLGLYICVFLTLAIVARLLADKLNVESPALFMLLIAGGTLLQIVLVGILLTILADTRTVFYILLPSIPQQVLANVLFTFFLFLCFTRLTPAGRGRRRARGLLRLGKQHGA
ncbi:MAG: rod shape-determining protein MreD [Desulfuromonas sp.]|nr:MAG: rod shape-determining protein MreD [Desulfuromonas sp.]